MSNYTDFIETRILRHPTTWLTAVIGAVWGGFNMMARHAQHRPVGTDESSMWLTHVGDFVVGAAFQIVFLMSAVWMIAGLMEEKSAWLRQSIVIALYIFVVWLTQMM